MLTLTEEQERQIREEAAQLGELPERVLAWAISLGLSQLFAEAEQVRNAKGKVS